jgi:hypothetical protein
MSRAQSSRSDVLSISLSRGSSRFRAGRFDAQRPWLTGLSYRVFYDQETGNGPCQYAEQEFEYDCFHGSIFLAQWDVHAVLLGAVATDYSPVGGFLNGVEAENLPPAVATNNDTLAH